MHEHYVRERRANGEKPGQNPSLVGWEQLDDALKQSNRRFATGCGAKLDATGCKLVRASAEGSATSFRFSHDETEALARTEHERWRRDLERDGWKWGAAKDPSKKEHPLLVPWSGLSEQEHEKDRAAIRGLPGMLMRAGFGIQRG